MKKRSFFKDISSDTWNSSEFQQDLKKRDELEHAYKKPNEIQPDSTTQEAIQAFSSALSSFGKQSPEKDNTISMEDTSEEKKLNKLKKDVQELSEGSQREFYEFLKSTLKNQDKKDNKQQKYPTYTNVF